MSVRPSQRRRCERGPSLVALIAWRGCHRKKTKQTLFKGGMMRANVLVVFAVATFVSGNAAAQTTALTHATVIDGTGAAPQTDVTIVMENGRIRQMAAGLAAPPNATVVDLTGKFVLRGITNGHGPVAPPQRSSR